METRQDYGPEGGPGCRGILVAVLATVALIAIIGLAFTLFYVMN